MNLTRHITVSILILTFAANASAQQGIGTLDKSAAPEPQPNHGNWHFQFTPYLWVAGISGRAGIGNLDVNVESGITNENVNINFGFMGTFEARKDRFIILTDVQYSNLGSELPTPGPLFSSATAEFKTFVLDPEVGYRVVRKEGGAFVDVVGGIRYWHLRTDLAFTQGLLAPISVTSSKGWVDGVGGIRGKALISRRLFVTGKADLGGGGSNLSYQLFGGVGLLLGKRFALIGGYRDLDVNYNKDGFLFDMALHGPVFGMSIRF
jgi:hypothetical protein